MIKVKLLNWRSSNFFICGDHSAKAETDTDVVWDPIVSLRIAISCGMVFDNPTYRIRIWLLVDSSPAKVKKWA